MAVPTTIPAPLDHRAHPDHRVGPGSSAAPPTADLRDAAAMVEVLRALGEPSRIRIGALLAVSELTVTDLTEILGQSQPRVSRHLRLLTDAGVVERHREGSWVFYGLAVDAPSASVVRSVLDGIDPDDPVVAADRERLEVVRAARAAEAHAYFERIAPVWDEERSLRPSESLVEAALLDLLGPGPIGRLLDLGTGTGRMLALLAPRADRAVGLDSSPAMLRVARANLDDELRCEFRQGDVFSPPFERGGFDLVVVHQVLHYLDEPARAVTEAVRLLAPGGRLLVVDLAPHRHEFLRDDRAHRRLGFTHDQLDGWIHQAGATTVAVRDIEPPLGDDGLTVTIWLAAVPSAPGTPETHP